MRDTVEMRDTVGACNLHFAMSEILVELKATLQWWYFNTFCKTNLFRTKV